MNENGTSNPTTTLCIEAIFHSNIVVYNNTSNLDAFHFSQFLSHLKIHDVARVIFNDHEDTSPLVRFLDSFQNLIWRWGREDSTCNGCRKHTITHKTSMSWLVTTSTTRNETNLTSSLLISCDDVKPLNTMYQITVNISQAI